MLGFNGVVLPSPLFDMFVTPFGLAAYIDLGGLASFKSMAGFIWVLVLMFIIFFLPNSLRVVEKITFKGALIARYEMPLAVICGVLLFVSLKTMVSVVDKEFIYFNF
jgi:hypothetical protein